MKKIYLLLCMMCIVFFTHAQVNVTATAGTANGSYPTVNDAFTAINAGTHQGEVTLTITASTTEPASPVRLLKSAAPSSYTTVVIKPSGNVTVNSAATPSANRGMIEFYGADSVIIDGDDPATAGARNLTFQMVTSTSTTAALRLSSTATDGTDGMTRSAVKNCIIIGSRSSATSTTASYGIVFTGISTTSLTGGAYSNTNILIENNEIRRSYYGIYANGASATYPNSGLVIRNNVIGSETSADNVGLAGIFISFTAATPGVGSAIIERNDVRAGDYGTGFSASVSGININSTNSGAIVRKNNIHDVSQPTTGGYGAYGINVSSATANTGITIENNFIRDMVASNYSASSTSFINYGIYVGSAATGLIINHNTIALQVPNPLGTVANSFSAAISIASSTATVAQLLNNIFVNTLPSTNAYAIYTAAVLNISGGTINNNDYYSPNGKVGYYNGAAQTTLVNWQTATGKDGASVSSLPNFISPTDLHVANAASELESAGAATATTGITDDIDNQVRPGPAGSVNGGGTAPDIGADEFDGIKVDLTSPSISYALLTGDCVTGNKSLTNVSIIDATGVPTTGLLRPRIYYRKNGAGAWYSQPGTLTSGTATNGTWSFTIVAAEMGGLAGNDFINYYIIAQDAASPANISSNPVGATATDVNNVTVHPATTNVVYVGAALSGNYTVGAGGAYTTLTQAINVYNASTCIGAPVNFILTDATYAGETFPITINNPGATSGTPLVIKPAAGVSPTLSGSVPNGALIRITGKYVTIDGSNTAGGTTRDLTLTNTSTTAPNVVLIGSTGTTPITNVAVRNTTVINGAVTSTAIVVSDAAAIGTAGYFNNITISNNSIQKAYMGIYNIAAVLAGNGSGLVISNNDLNSTGANSIAYVGIYLQGIDGPMVNTNRIGNFDAAGGQDDKGIWVATGTINATVERNNITNLGYTGTSGYGGHGIYVSTGATNANVRVTNNMVSNMFGDGYDITLTATDNPIGIVVTGTQTGVFVQYNTISLTGNSLNRTGALSMGMYIGTGTVATITHNIISNNLGLTAASGIGSVGIYATTGSSQFASLNYNDYSIAPTGTGAKYFGQIGTTTYASLATWQAATGQDAQSLNVLPSFVDATTGNLHLTAAGNAALHYVAPPVAGIPYDYDGETRGAPLTDIGADELLNAVPVTMLDLNGARVNAVNNLTWTTLTEINNRGFDLERSADGSNFTSLAFVASRASNGNSVSRIDYKFADIAALPGVNYYRLKQVDFDGRFTYSNIVRIQPLKVATLSVEGVYPNPVVSVLNIKLASPASAMIKLMITDLSGRTVVERTASAAAGDNVLSLNVSALPSGMYMLKATCGNGCSSSVIKFEKQ